MSEQAEKPRVIIVEDDRDLREILASALEDEGFEVGQVANGLRLVSHLHVNQPDLIVLDVNLSWIDGFELCRALKASEDYRDIPVVFLSGRSSRADIERGMDVGASEYFTKPVDLLQLIGRLRELIAESRARAAEH
jgi:DNA-binding response OmpR family regulator